MVQIKVTCSSFEGHTRSKHTCKSLFSNAAKNSWLYWPEFEIWFGKRALTGEMTVKATNSTTPNDPILIFWSWFDLILVTWPWIFIYVISIKCISNSIFVFRVSDGGGYEEKEKNEEAARWVRERLTRMLPLQATNSSKKSTTKIRKFLFSNFFQKLLFWKIF